MASSAFDPFWSIPSPIELELAQTKEALAQAVTCSSIPQGQA
jgi:hypothetical protein